ncbi:GNAT family N-acetyltransferase [Salidesulfovibrio onnuriiensis]|uniref:GNAT family N-acetyltransferase n=1 Tax=Salidesulfovibrio onnuriiensis TaxID=2583823 RepID=UPI00164F430A|nr:GNAT family N-acetyltransferase [Salidesulfovibrio onnuriiensis]
MSREEYIRRLEKTPYTIEHGQKAVIDLFRPEDALGVARCYHSIWADAFPVDYVYDPEQIIRQNEGDNHFTAVARTESGDIVGLGGMFRTAPNPGIYELGQLMVLKEYRHTRIGFKLNDFLMSTLPEKYGMECIFGQPVTTHLFTQKLGVRYKTTECGMEIDVMPAEAFEHEGGGAHRVTLVDVLRVDKPRRNTAYLPEAYRDFITSRHALLGVQRDLGDPSGPSGDETESAFSDFRDSRVARLVVSAVGRDFESVLQNAERETPESLMQVHLNLGDPAAPGTVELLRERGYFLGGLLPQWFETDGFIMQKLPWKPDFGVVNLHTDEAKAMLELIRRDWERTQE